MIAATLPLPPSTNNLYANVPGKGRVKTRAYKAWLTEAGYILNIAIVAKRIDGPYSLTLKAGRPNRLRDLGNLEKPVSDLLVAHGAIRDDRDCQKIEAEWIEGVTGVYVAVRETVAVPLMDGKKPREPRPYRKTTDAYRAARKRSSACPSLSEREGRS